MDDKHFTIQAFMFDAFGLALFLTGPLFTLGPLLALLSGVFGAVMGVLGMRRRGDYRPYSWPAAAAILGGALILATVLKFGVFLYLIPYLALR